MSLSKRIKPISYLKSHTAEVVSEMTATGNPLIVTQNGEAKAVFQDIASWEQTQETLALLKILALGTHEIDKGKIEPAADVFKRLRAGKGER